MAEVANGPTVTEIARRLQRVEDKLDERIATVDMLRSTEKLFEAKDLTYAATIQAHESRIDKLETANSRLMIGVVLAFLGLLVQVLVQVMSAAGKGP